jgi:ABC-2 type transport system permease protein
MTKFLAIVKREYVQRVRTKMFVVMTILGPVLLGVFTIVPALLMNIQTGVTRIAVVDQTDGSKLYRPIRDTLLKKQAPVEKVDVAGAVNSNAQERMEQAGRSSSGRFSVEPVNITERSLADVKRELNQKIGAGELDGYLIIPPDILKGGKSKVIYYGRNVSDMITRGQIEERINRAVSRQRLIEAGVKRDLDELSKPVDLESYSVNRKGEEGAKDIGAGFIVGFIVGFLIYLTVLMYGQVILGAVIEEKETRIAEILFSSVRSFTLMIGKLVGVSLVALTQLSIWLAAFALLSLWGLSALAARGAVDVNIPQLPAMFFLYFFLFFVLGYFIYATIYALVGSMVTTTQEGGQLALPVVFLLMTGLYLSFPVIRSPSSSFAMWVSLVPFFSPVTMVVRIVSETPPFWQIALSLLIGFVTVLFLLWLASRIYRVGMLMYGKKASIPEVMRWVRQA